MTTQKVCEIIQEELGAFFAEDKTAEETAEIIQNRVKLYVNETASFLTGIPKRLSKTLFPPCI